MTRNRQESTQTKAARSACFRRDFRRGPSGRGAPCWRRRELDLQGGDTSLERFVFLPRQPGHLLDGLEGGSASSATFTGACLSRLARLRSLSWCGFGRQFCSRGSRMSRSASPNRLVPKTTRLMAMPGKTTSHGAVRTYSAADSESIRPHEG